MLSRWCIPIIADTQEGLEWVIANVAKESPFGFAQATTDDHMILFYRITNGVIERITSDEFNRPSWFKVSTKYRINDDYAYEVACDTSEGTFASYRLVITVAGAEMYVRSIIDGHYARFLPGGKYGLFRPDADDFAFHSTDTSWDFNPSLPVTEGLWGISVRQAGKEIFPCVAFQLESDFLAYEMAR